MRTKFRLVFEAKTWVEDAFEIEGLEWVMVDVVAAGAVTSAPEEFSLMGYPWPFVREGAEEA